jgi:hypothetical protein
MTTFNLTCEAVEATLPDYLDETLEPWVRTSIEEHLSECVRCAALARELRNITREASALPALVPERDIWARIAGRIGAPVIVSAPVPESEPFPQTTAPIVLASEPSPPIREPRAVAIEPPVSATEPTYGLPDRREKRWGPAWMGLAAAALVLVTAATTSLLTVQWLGRARTPNNVASSDPAAPKRSPSERAAKPRVRTPSAGRDQPASGSAAPPLAPAPRGSALTVATTTAPPVTTSPEEAVYDKEINMLQKVVRRQKADLDASTVAVIERNLRTVDSAIAQIRAALQKDPESSLLGGQVSRALEMKVELLRRVAMLLSNS